MSGFLGMLIVPLLVLLIVVVIMSLMHLGHRLPEQVQSNVQKFQPLLGSCFALIAAILALSGVLKGVEAQSANTRMQLQEQAKAQREAEQRTATAHRKSVAAAFGAEISVITQIFSGPEWIQTAQMGIENVERSATYKVREKVDLTSTIPGPDYGTYYKASAGEVGQLGPEMAQKVVAFYGVYFQLRDNLDLMQRVIRGDVQLKVPEVGKTFIHQKQGLERLEEYGNILVPALQKIASEDEAH